MTNLKVHRSDLRRHELLVQDRGDWQLRLVLPEEGGWLAGHSHHTAKGSINMRRRNDSGATVTVTFSRVKVIARSQRRHQLEVQSIGAYLQVRVAEAQGWLPVRDVLDQTQKHPALCGHLHPPGLVIHGLGHCVGGSLH